MRFTITITVKIIIVTIIITITPGMPQAHVDLSLDDTDGQPEYDENADTAQMLTYMVKSMKGLRHNTILIVNKVSYIEEYLESVEIKLDNCIPATEVLYDRQMEETKTRQA